MRATIDGFEVEGTPAEIAELLASVRDRSAAKVGLAAAQVDLTVDDGDEISETFAYRTLKRIPLSMYQRVLLRKLRHAHPDWVLASEITREFEWSGTQLGGVLGGLGRRLTATKGYKRGYELWNWKWNEDEGEYAYRLPPAVAAAFDRLET